MKSSAARDRLLKMLLPGLLVFVVYVVYFLSSKQKALSKAEEALTSTRSKAPPPQLLLSKQAEVDRVQQELNKVAGNSQTLKKEWDALMGPFARADQRAARVEKLHALLEGSYHSNVPRLEVLKVGPIDAGSDTRDLKLSPTQENLLKLLIENNGGQKPTLFRVQVAGSYWQVVGFLQALDAQETIAIPLGIAMKEEKGVKRWTILIWI